MVFLSSPLFFANFFLLFSLHPDPHHKARPYLHYSEPLQASPPSVQIHHALLRSWLQASRQTATTLSSFLILVPWLGNQDAITIATGKQPDCPLPHPCAGAGGGGIYEQGPALAASSAQRGGHTRAIVCGEGRRHHGWSRGHRRQRVWRPAAGRFGATIKHHLRRRRHERIFFWFSGGKSKMRPPSRLVLKCNPRCNTSLFLIAACLGLRLLT
jgi:hypothetical protein